MGKGNKERRIYLKLVIVKMLQTYIRDVKLTGFLFPGHAGRPISGSAMQSRFKRYVRAAGLTKPVTPHSLRHTIAVQYLMGGGSLRTRTSGSAFAKIGQLDVLYTLFGVVAGIDPVNRWRGGGEHYTWPWQLC